MPRQMNVPRRARSARSRSIQQILAQRQRRPCSIRFVQAASRQTCSSCQLLSSSSMRNTSRALLPTSHGPRKSLHFKALLTPRLDFLLVRQVRFLPAIQIPIRYLEQLLRRHYPSTWATPLPPCAPTLLQMQRRPLTAQIKPLMHLQTTPSPPRFLQVPLSWLTTSR